MRMESELKELKSVLRSLVVSSPTEMDLRTLLRDYRNMMGEAIPLAKFGYRDGLAFIKEQCSDCFVIQDAGCNPVLTLIVTDAVKHIDAFVQKQKFTPKTRFKSKRRISVPETVGNRDLIVRTFKTRVNNIQKTECTMTEENRDKSHKDENSNSHVKGDFTDEKHTNGVCNGERNSTKETNGVCSSNALHNFMKKRIPIFNSCQYLDSETCLDKDSSKGDTDSGRQTSSSNSSGKKALLEELKIEVRELIAEVPEGVWCTELMRLYREKYRRELNFSRFGFTSVLGLAYAVEGLAYCVAEHTGELLLQAAGAGGAGGVGDRCARPAPTAAPARPRPAHCTGDPEDALPGIDFDEDVFPADCMHIMQSVPAQALDELAAGAMLQVVVGEVYSPSHFWLLRLGPAHYSAMEAIMDDMNTYYRGEGRERVLAGGAVRVGHYCACCYLGDWHRAVIVKILDSDTVKVRHVDYATVETVSARSLKPLLRHWAALPAQALRARLAGARPSAAGRRWPWAASAHFLHLVKERRLIANVVAKDAQEGILEVLLIDTSTEEDVCISSEMCRSGHADPRPDSALGTSECYLYPRFDALETGNTPNYAEIYCYLRDGISLEFVEDYRRHVPSCVPPAAPLAPRSPREPSPPPRESSPAAASTSRDPSPGPPPVVSRSSIQVADRLFKSSVRATSLSPTVETGSWGQNMEVVNRVPLLHPEPGAPRARRPPGPHPHGWQSLPPGGFPAPAHPHEPALGGTYLSPFAPAFYPQSYREVPPLQYFPAPFPSYPPQRPQFHPGPLPALTPDGVSVPASECEIFALLSRVDPPAAHRYMMDALSRAVANTLVTCGSPAPRVSPAMSAPPPGFGCTLRPPAPARPPPDK